MRRFGSLSLALLAVFTLGALLSNSACRDLIRPCYRFAQIVLRKRDSLSHYQTIVKQHSETHRHTYRTLH
jgi:hypothetical protein